MADQLVNLEEHVAAGGTHELATLDDGRVVCPLCRQAAWPFVFQDVRERTDISADWRCDGCWSVELRAVRAFARAMRPEVLSNDMYERVEQLMVWNDLPDWRTCRRRGYRGIEGLLAEALADQALGDGAKMAEYEAAREAIREQYPKPAKVVVINGVEWPSDLPEAQAPVE